MALDDLYYQTVVRQHAAEAQAHAERQQLVAIARTAAKRERATRREVRLLRDSVEGRRGLRQRLRDVLSDRFARTTRPAPTGPTGPVGTRPADASDPTTAADRQPSAGAR